MRRVFYIQEVKIFYVEYKIFLSWDLSSVYLQTLSIVTDSCLKIFLTLHKDVFVVLDKELDSLKKRRDSLDTQTLLLTFLA